MRPRFRPQAESRSFRLLDWKRFCRTHLGYASRKWETFGVQSPRCSRNHPDATTIVLDAATITIATISETAQAKVRAYLRAEKRSTWVKWVPSSGSVCRRFLLPVISFTGQGPNEGHLAALNLALLEC